MTSYRVTREDLGVAGAWIVQRKDFLWWKTIAIFDVDEHGETEAAALAQWALERLTSELWRSHGEDK